MDGSEDSRNRRQESMAEPKKKAIAWSMLTMRELRKLAGELDVVGRSGMTRGELVRALQNRAYRNPDLAAHIMALADRPRGRRLNKSNQTKKAGIGRFKPLCPRTNHLPSVV